MYALIGRILVRIGDTHPLDSFDAAFLAVYGNVLVYIVATMVFTTLIRMNKIGSAHCEWDVSLREEYRVFILIKNE